MALAAALRVNTALTRLELASNKQLTASGAEALAEALASNASLALVNLRDNFWQPSREEVGDDGEEGTSRIEVPAALAALRGRCKAEVLMGEMPSPLQAGA